MRLEEFAESPVVQQFLALSPERQRIVRLLVERRIGAGPVHEEARSVGTRRAARLLAALRMQREEAVTAN